MKLLSLIRERCADVPLFVEHCEAVAAEIDVKLRWLGEQARRGRSVPSHESLSAALPVIVTPTAAAAVSDGMDGFVVAA
jgi:hypothetical protein